MLTDGETLFCSAAGGELPAYPTNPASAPGEDTTTDAMTSATDPSHYFGSEAKIAIEKSTNGEDADTETGPFIPVGALVEFCYVVTNTGEADLENVVVTDVLAPQCDNNIGFLAAGDSEGLRERYRGRENLDVSGKVVGAGILMSMIRTGVLALNQVETSPAKRRPPPGNSAMRSAARAV